jgi:hypothetical protein
MCIFSYVSLVIISYNLLLCSFQYILLLENPFFSIIVLDAYASFRNLIHFFEGLEYTENELKYLLFDPLVEDEL